MSLVLTENELSSEEFLELPENGRDRMLIRGQLWDKPTTYRNPFHSAVIVRLGFLLEMWLSTRPHLNLKVLGGVAGFLLRDQPGSIVGIDVAVAAKDQPMYTHKNRVILAGHPLLAAEILSPSDRQRDIQARVDEYLAVGVPLVWILDSHFRTVTVHRPGLPPCMVTEQDELSGDGVLVDFAVPVRQIFETL